MPEIFYAIKVKLSENCGLVVCAAVGWNPGCLGAPNTDLGVQHSGAGVQAPPPSRSGLRCSVCIFWKSLLAVFCCC